jgi:hypothetical protein
LEPCYLLLEAALGPASSSPPAYQENEEKHEGKADASDAVEQAESSDSVGTVLASGNCGVPWHDTNALAGRSV